MKFNQKYEKIKIKGYCNPSQMKYLLEKGCDMSGIEQKYTAPAPTKMTEARKLKNQVSSAIEDWKNGY